MDDKSPVMAEYRQCCDMIIASAHESWLAGTLFIGGAFTGLIFTITTGRNLNPYELLLITIGVVILLLAVKGYFINEEWRQKRCYDRMLELENGGGIDTEIIGRIHRLTTHSPLRYFRFPWRMELTLPTDTKEEKKRTPFGWEFLHISAWIAIIVWIFLCCMRWDYCPAVTAGLWLGLIAVSVLLGQFLPISGVRLFGRKNKNGGHLDSTKPQKPIDYQKS